MVLERILDVHLLHGLREDTGCSLASIQTLFDEVSINAGVPTQNVGHLIQTCLYRLDIESKKTNNDISSFLNKGLEMEWIGEFSKKHSVSKDFLLSQVDSGFSNTIMTTMGSVSNGLLLELNNFRNRKGYSVEVLLSWLQSLCDSFNNMTPAQLNKLVKKTSNDMKSLQKRKGYIGGVERLQEFQELSCQPSPTTNSATGVTCCQPQELQSRSVSEPCRSGTGHTSSPQESIPVSDAESQMLTASVAQQFDIARSQTDAVRELLSDEKATVHLLQDKVQKLQKVNEILKSKLHASRTREAATKAKLRQISEQCTKLKRSNINRRFVRLKNKHEQMVAKLHSVQPLAAELQNEKQKKRHYQKRVSRLEQKHKQMKEELEEVIKSFLDERLELQPVVPETRTERGYFRDFVVTCIYELVGECEVPASRCREVIKTV